MDKKENIRRLMAPKTIAFIGGTAMADAVMSVAHFAVANADSVLELDVNPLMVLDKEAVAAFISRAAS